MSAFIKFSRAITVIFLWVACMSPGASVRGGSHQLPTTTYEDRDQGIRLYRQRDIEGALKALRLGLRKFKDDGIAWHYLGLSLVAKEDWKGAGKALEKAITLLPSSAPSFAALAYSLLFTKGVKDAEKQANRALSLEPENALAHYVIGTIRLWQGSCAEAHAQADAALVSSSDFSAGHFLRYLSLICDIAKTSVKPSVNMKRNALRFKEAAQSLERSLQLAPVDADAPMWREQLETLRLYAEPAGRPDAERTVFTGVEVTTKPRALSKPEPTYPDSAKGAQVQGTVVLRAVFGADGKVSNILVLNPLPNGLTERAIAAARMIRFEPATKDGRTVSMFVQIEYNFNLY